MKKIVVATNNSGKLKEMKDILKGIEIVSLKDVGIIIEVEEDQDTFEGNALKKAKEVYELVKLPCIADDSGLCIEYLQGFP
ncbi:MAG: non-canonical purine NTP pyrophosphatase, partial [Clostridia bacterium]